MPCPNIVNKSNWKVENISEDYDTYTFFVQQHWNEIKVARIDTHNLETDSTPTHKSGYEDEYIEGQSSESILDEVGWSMELAFDCCGGN